MQPSPSTRGKGKTSDHATLRAIGMGVNAHGAQIGSTEKKMQGLLLKMRQILRPDHCTMKRSSKFGSEIHMERLNIGVCNTQAAGTCAPRFTGEEVRHKANSREAGGTDDAS